MRYYILIFLSLLTDLVLWRWYTTPVIACTRACYYALLGTYTNYPQIIIAGLGVIIESFIWYSLGGYDLLILLPAFFVMIFLPKFINLRLFLQIFIALFFLLAHFFVLDYYIAHKSIKSFFSAGNIFAYVIIIAIMLYYIRGSQGNRSK